jgi:hypothetical protein
MLAASLERLDRLAIVDDYELTALFGRSHPHGSEQSSELLQWPGFLLH